jgi:hypothetical protein
LRWSLRPMRSGSIESRFVKKETKSPIECSVARASENRSISQ